ncbi:hypothetical protein D3C72_1855130 [compost metagenome]
MISSRVSPSICATTAVEATLTSTTWSSPTLLNEFSSAMQPWISCALIMAVSTVFIVSGLRPAAMLLREIQSAVARMPPRLSEGCPHSAASQVSLKSSQRIIVPILNAAWTGSSWYCVPGTRAPLGTIVPGTMGPSSLVQAG